MEKAELLELLRTEELTLTDVIDAVIELNGLIGVGLISLADDLSKYIIDNRKGYEVRQWIRQS